jgi:hypothetical protein
MLLSKKNELAVRGDTQAVCDLEQFAIDKSPEQLNL